MNTGVRISREKDTVSKMIHIYCRKNHQTSGTLCDSCHELKEYTDKRLSYCRFGEDKPTCEKCPIHCYKSDKKEEVKNVMKFAGPRMIIYHPVCAVQHLIKNIRSSKQVEQNLKGRKRPSI